MTNVLVEEAATQTSIRLEGLSCVALSSTQCLPVQLLGSLHLQVSSSSSSNIALHHHHQPIPNHRTTFVPSIQHYDAFLHLASLACPRRKSIDPRPTKPQPTHAHLPRTYISSSLPTSQGLSRLSASRVRSRYLCVSYAGLHDPCAYGSGQMSLLLFYDLAASYL